MDNDNVFEMSWEVREYECDLQGIVNNAVYLNYLENARNAFLKQKGTNIAILHDKGIDIVLARVNMALKTPLRPGDEIVSKLRVRKERIKYVFDQELYRKSDNKIACKATIETVCLINGKLGSSDFLDQLLFK